MGVTETAVIMAVMVTEGIHPEMVVTPRPTEDTSTKYSFRSSEYIYRVYYEKGMHRATFFKMHRIVSAWSSRNPAVFLSDEKFGTIESLYRCLTCLIVLEQFRFHGRGSTKTIVRFVVKTGKLLRRNVSFVSGAILLLV